MECGAFAALSRGDPLPLSSLRLLVPPLQLMVASMWQVLKKQDVLTYWAVAEYASLVMDTVPDLLMHKHRLQLLLGLRARYILELCRNEQLLDHDVISSHLEKIKSCPPALDVKESGPDIVDTFLELIQALLKDPEARQNFFAEVLPVEYAARYDSDLQTLFAEFVFRLNQLLPIPDMEQRKEKTLTKELTKTLKKRMNDRADCLFHSNICGHHCATCEQLGRDMTVSWLGNRGSLLEDCEHSVSEPADLITLLQHHKNLGHFEQHVPPSGMGDGILSTLSALSSSRPTRSDPPRGSSDHPHVVSFVDDVAVEVITVTDYSEVELSTSADKEEEEEEEEEEAARGENGGGGSDAGSSAGETVAALPDEPVEDEGGGGGGGEEERAAPSLTDVVLPETSQDDSPSPRHDASPGPHDCPHCKKKFKFASSLTAHSVVHTGERPHGCGECGRRFSFRQSLDRHRHTHAHTHETFRSLSAYSEHKRKKEVTGEPTPARQQKIRTDDDDDDDDDGDDDDDPNANRTSGSHAGEREAAGDGEGQRRASERSADVTPAKVRTSGRKRKPTMKIRALNLEKDSQRGKKSGKTAHVTPDCVEHSYGSSTPSTHSAESSSAAVSSLKCSFHPSEEMRVRSETEDDDLSVADQRGGFSCPDCEKSFRFRSQLKAHRRVHTGEQPFLCPQCGCRFSFKQSLERHKLTHDSGRDHACPVCGRFFQSLAALKEHGGAHVHVENGEYLCSECGRAFAWKSALVRHRKTHGEEASAPAESCKCPHCELLFSSHSYLSKHLQTHRARTHACSCGKSFPYRAALTAHQRTHQKERPHVCAQCGKGFLYRGGLLSHMKIHSEEMPFMCSFCGKSFKRERNMKKHERRHTGEDVFRCSQCDKSFVYKATLIRHELTHSGERPYLCSDCGKGFFSHAELLKHERFHTGHKPFQCPDCGKRFTQSCYLTIHLRYHSGARPYSCAQCDKRFLSANRLKRHQRIHTGEKPYLCVECGKGFRQSYNLKMHQKTHVMKLT